MSWFVSAAAQEFAGSRPWRRSAVTAAGAVIDGEQGKDAGQRESMSAARLAAAAAPWGCSWPFLAGIWLCVSVRGW
jgi:hypothetical protein